MAFLPHLGVQNDEALFAHAIYEPYAGLPTVRIGHSRFPVMLMSYLGTLKAWIYRPVFRVFGTGVWALRLPALIAGAATIWLFYLLLRRIAGVRAAIIGCSLLAVDSMYMLTACFDWGPVVLQHLLLIGSGLLLMKFYQERQDLALAAGFFLLGLAMWDKALAVWMLTGAGIGGILTFPRQILDVTTRRRVAISVLAFVLGALPLLVYNAKNHWATFHGNFKLDTGDIPNKAALLLNTARGPALFDWLVNEDWKTTAPHKPEGTLQNAAFRIAEATGRPRQNLMVYAFGLALLLAPFAGKARRAILFALIAMVVAWVQMAVNASTGGSAHHAILLWPLPELVIAISLAGASRRLAPRAAIPALAAVLVAALVSCVLVTNHYYVLAIRNGGAENWTDAIYSLSDYLKRVPSNNVVSMDWGIMDSLRLLNRGKLHLAVGTEQVSKPEMSADDRQIVQRMIAQPGNVFVDHTAAFEFFHDNAKMLKFAEDEGYQPETMAIIADSYGWPTYEVYRFQRPL